MDSQTSQQDSTFESPILPSLASKMTVEINFSSNKKVSILHKGKLPFVLKWVEYDPDLNTLTLVSETGQMQDVGLKIPDSYKNRFAITSHIFVVRVGDKGMEDFYDVPLMHNDYGLA